MMISNRETGLRIRKLLAERQISVREVQERMGLESTQAVYKWLHGKSLPSLENMAGLSQMLGVSIEEILVNTAEAGAGKCEAPGQTGREEVKSLPGNKIWYMKAPNNKKIRWSSLETGRERAAGRPMPVYLRRLLLAGKVIDLSQARERRMREGMGYNQTKATGGRG